MRAGFQRVSWMAMRWTRRESLEPRCLLHSQGVPERLHEPSTVTHSWAKHLPPGESRRAVSKPRAQQGYKELEKIADNLSIMRRMSKVPQIAHSSEEKVEESTAKMQVHTSQKVVLQSPHCPIPCRWARKERKNSSHGPLAFKSSYPPLLSHYRSPSSRRSAFPPSDFQPDLS